jgi:RND family efflux transporter MFP subunit
MSTRNDPGQSAIFACFAWLVVAASMLGCGTSGNEYVEPPPPEVTYALPIQAPITPFTDEIGLTEAANEAEVRSRVRGFLKSVEFQPGEEVKQGDLLYTIEKDQYQAAYDSAQAAVQTAEAAIGVAQASVKIADAEKLRANQDLDREKRLKEQNASSQAEYDAAVAGAAAAEAKLEAATADVESAKAEKARAEAAFEQAKLDLLYTDVRAEIDGRITKSNFKVGNLVENGSHLATIVDDREIFANFSVSDRAVLRIMEVRREAGISPEGSPWRGMPVFMAREGDQGYPFEGKLDDVDQAGVDADTGTLALRATFDNPSSELLPGLFVSLRVPAANAVESLLVPARAVLRDQEGPYVLTIDGENKIDRARINLGQSVSGWAIVLGGIDPSTRVVVDGIQFARPGGTVVPEEARYEVDAVQLLRGLSDPDRAREPLDDTDSSGGQGQASSGEPNQTQQP